MKGKGFYYFLFILIFIVLSAAWFILASKRDSFFWTSYAFTLGAAAWAFISGLLLSGEKGKSAADGFPLMPLAQWYMTAVLLIVIVLDLIFAIDYKWYLLIHIIALSAALSVFVYMLFGGKNLFGDKENGDKKIIDYNAMVEEAERIIMLTGELDESIKQRVEGMVRGLYDNIESSSTVEHRSLRRINEEIMDDILALNHEIEHLAGVKSENCDSAEEIVKKVNRKIMVRNMKLKGIKYGERSK